VDDGQHRALESGQRLLEPGARRNVEMIDRLVEQYEKSLTCPAPILQPANTHLTPRADNAGRLALFEPSGIMVSENL
jgi:hypothetical protein